MTDSLPSPTDRPSARRDLEEGRSLDDADHTATDPTSDAGASHDEQPGFQDGPISPAEGGD
jgi:hypothetical protein